MSDAPAATPAKGSLLLLSFFTLIGFAILFGLGVWQVQRLHWKEDLIARIDARIHAEPGPVPPSSQWPSLKPDDYDYTHVRATGRFDDREALIFRGVGKVGNGPAQPGYWVMKPLHLTQGGTVLVNRGFVPLTSRDPATRPDSDAGREATVTGLLRAPEERGMFTPADDPAKAQWFTRDPRAIAASLGLSDAAPFSIDEDAHEASPGAPAGGATVFDIPNNHLSYAGTWFALAATLLAFFGYFVWRRRRVTSGGT